MMSSTSISANDNTNAAAAAISLADHCATRLCENSNNFANTMRSVQKVLSKLGSSNTSPVVIHTAANAFYSDYRRAATAEEIARHIIQEYDKYPVPRTVLQLWKQMDLIVWILMHHLVGVVLQSQ